MKRVNWKKWLPYLVIIFGILYDLWPLDLLPDIPLIGWIDDLGVTGGVIIFLLRHFAKRKKEKDEEGELITAKEKQ